MIDLADAKQRHEYMASKLRMDIAYQVRLLRLQRDWTQDQLAERCHTEQPAISTIENWNAPFPEIPTLRRIASAFDCGLVVRFESWEEVINSMCPDYENDPVINSKVVE